MFDSINLTKLLSLHQFHLYRYLTPPPSSHIFQGLAIILVHKFAGSSHSPSIKKRTQDILQSNIKLTLYKNIFHPWHVFSAGHMSPEQTMAAPSRWAHSIARRLPRLKNRPLQPHWEHTTLNKVNEQKPPSFPHTNTASYLHKRVRRQA